MKADHRYLCFNLGAEEFALPLLSIREVIAKGDITPLPQMPPYFLGIMNLRGEVISVIDLRLKLGLKPAQSQEASIIVIDYEGIRVGLLVDLIESVQSPPEEQLGPPPDLLPTNAEVIMAVFRRENNLVLILDLKKVLGTLPTPKAKGA